MAARVGPPGHKSETSTFLRRAAPALDWKISRADTRGGSSYGSGEKVAEVK